MPEKDIIKNNLKSVTLNNLMHLFHKWTPWQQVDTVKIFLHDDAGKMLMEAPYETHDVYKKHCMKCGIPETKRVRI